MIINQKLIDRFWPKVKKGDGCWEWQAGLTKLGYGFFMVGRIPVGAHRVSWLIANPTKVLIKGMVIGHTCDNRKCVNPAHLEQITQQENIQQCITRGRSKAGYNLRRKITWENVQEIRKEAVTWEGMCMMMLKHKVSQSTIHEIMTFRSWKIPPKVM